jgi:hypothetical protein
MKRDEENKGAAIEVHSLKSVAFLFLWAQEVLCCGVQQLLSGISGRKTISLPTLWLL